MSMKVMAVTFLSALCGCAGMVREMRTPAVERLDGRGVGSSMLLVEAESVLRFVNADARPHQIYSNDCGEVSSTVLNPGGVYSTQVGTGLKICHFQDLWSPLDAGYAGTLHVQAQEPVLTMGETR